MSLSELLVIGSLHYDIFLESSHLPRKGETVKGKNWYPKFGGKGGNQAIAASRYPVPTKLVSAVGKDNFSHYILENLKKNNVDIDYVQQIDHLNSGMSVAISNAEGDYGAIIISGSNLYINSEIINNDNLWKNIKILMIQNEIEENLNVLAAKKAKEKNVQVFYNAAPAKEIHSDLYGLVDVLLVNTIEAEDITGIKITNMDCILECAQKLSNHFPITLISAGEQGVVLCEKNKKPIHVNGVKVKVKSTHGAGDVFAGTFCAALLSKKNIKEATNVANLKASEFVQT